LGWVAGGAVADGQPVREQDIRLGGALVHPDSSLRTALDSALSSPSGRGIVVDDDGVLVGSVTAAEVLDRVPAESA